MRLISKNIRSTPLNGFPSTHPNNYVSRIWSSRAPLLLTQSNNRHDGDSSYENGPFIQNNFQIFEQLYSNTSNISLSTLPLKVTAKLSGFAKFVFSIEGRDEKSVYTINPSTIIETSLFSSDLFSKHRYFCTYFRQVHPRRNLQGCTQVRRWHKNTYDTTTAASP